MSKTMTVGQLIKVLKKCETSDEVLAYFPGLDEGIPVTDYETGSGYVGLYLGESGVPLDPGKVSALELLDDIVRSAGEAADRLKGDGH
jgi:hypothetical protein